MSCSSIAETCQHAENTIPEQADPFFYQYALLAKLNTATSKAIKCRRHEIFPQSSFSHFSWRESGKFGSSSGAKIRKTFFVWVVGIFIFVGGMVG
jgi:hypothetical protein